MDPYCLLPRSLPMALSWVGWGRVFAGCMIVPTLDPTRLWGLGLGRLSVINRTVAGIVQCGALRLTRGNRTLL